MTTDPARKWLIIATTCALVPLLSGILAFLYWLPTRDPLAEVAGMVIIGLGVVLVPIGLVCAWLAARAGRKSPSNDDGFRAVLVAGLLLANFPACLAILFAVDTIRSQWKIELVNEAEVPLDSVTLRCNDRRDLAIESVPAGARIERTVTFSCEGVVTYVVRGRGRSFEGEAVGYVSGGSGGTLRLTVEEDRVIAVEKHGR